MKMYQKMILRYLENLISDLDLENSENIMFPVNDNEDLKMMLAIIGAYLYMEKRPTNSITMIR